MKVIVNCNEFLDLEELGVTFMEVADCFMGNFVVLDRIDKHFSMLPEDFVKVFDKHKGFV